MAKSKRRSYLNDYQQGMNGEYYYTGAYMAFDGSPEERKALNIRMIVISVILAILFIVPGLLDAGKLWNTFYVLIPFALEGVMLFIMVWKMIRLIIKKEPLKEYEYKQLVPQITGFGMVAMVAAAVEIIGCAVYMIISDGIVVYACVILLVAKALTVGLLIWFRIYLGSLRWNLQNG